MLVEQDFLDFVSIGAPRAGSTWLAGVLREHPDLFVPAQKGLNAFNDRHPSWRGYRPVRDDLAAYRLAFQGAPPRALLGEVSPFYLYDPNCAARLGACFPDVKVIAVLRQPLDMLVSLYHDLRHRSRRAATFEAEIERRPHLLDLAHYHRLLTPWFDRFPKERIHVGVYEPFFEDERESLRGLLRFLGVSDRFRSSLFGRKVNPAPRRPPGRLSPLWGDAKRLVGWTRERAPSYQGVRKRFTLARPSDALDADFRRRIMDGLEPDLRRLETLLGRDLGDWREPEPVRPPDNVVPLERYRPRPLPAARDG